MEILKHLTPDRFQLLLFEAYQKGQESKNIKVIDLIEEIKKQILLEK
jgi:hypothetical protein